MINLLKFSKKTNVFIIFVILYKKFVYIDDKMLSDLPDHFHYCQY